MNSKILSYLVDNLAKLAIIMIGISLIISNLINEDYSIAITNIIIIVLAYYSYQKLEEKDIIIDNKKLNKLFIIGILILIIIQVLFIYIFMMQPEWDFGWVTNIARIKSYQQNLPQEHILYLYNYPFNYSLVLIYEFLFKILGYNINILFILGLIVIDISIIIIYMTLKNNFSNSTVAKISLIMLLFYPYISYVLIPYSDILALPFLSLAIFIIYRNNKINYDFKTVVLFSLVIGIGALFKVLVLIIPIAYFIYGIIILSKFKKLIVIIPFIIVIILNHQFGLYIDSKYYSYAKFSESGLTPLYWMYAGLNNDSMGQYNINDYNESLKWGIRLTKEEKAEVTKFYQEGIIERLNKLKISGIVEIIQHKLNITWSDGTYGMKNYINIRPIRDSRTREFFASGEGKYIILFYSQLIHFSLMIGLSKLLKNQGNLFFKLVFLGFFGYLLLFEAGPRYILLFSPILYIINALYLDKEKEIKL